MKKLFVLSFITLLIISGVQNVKAETFTQKDIDIGIIDAYDASIQEVIQINSIEIFKPGGCLTDNLFYPYFKILTNDFQNMIVEATNIFINKINLFQDYSKAFRKDLIT